MFFELNYGEGKNVGAKTFAELGGFVLQEKGRPKKIEVGKGKWGDKTLKTSLVLTKSSLNPSKDGKDKKKINPSLKKPTDVEDQSPLEGIELDDVYIFSCKILRTWVFGA